MLKEESYTEREPWKSVEDPFLVFSRVLINIYMGGNYLRSRKELFKKKKNKIRGNRTWYSHTAKKRA